MKNISKVLVILIVLVSLIYNERFVEKFKDLGNKSGNKLSPLNIKDNNAFSQKITKNQEINIKEEEETLYDKEIIKEYDNGFNLLFWNKNFSISYKWNIIHDFETINLSINPFILDEWCSAYNKILLNDNQQITQEYKSTLWNNQTKDFKYNCLKDYFKNIINIDNISENIFVVKKSWYEWFSNYLYIPWTTEELSDNFWDWEFKYINNYKQGFVFLFKSNRWDKTEVIYINKAWKEILLADSLEDIITFYNKSSVSWKYWYSIEEIILKWDMLIINYISIDSTDEWLSTHYVNLTEL